jgi:hypothetical protein
MYKSEAQRRKFQELHAQGKITTEVLNQFNQRSQGKQLPDRLHPSKPVNSFPKTRKSVKRI